MMSRNKDYELMKFTDGRTKQNFKEDVDINRIMERWTKSGQAPAFLMAPGQKQAVDISSAVDFHTAMNNVRASQRLFSSFSAKIRSRFDNDPEKFLRFMEDPKNAQEAVDLGIAVAPKAPPGPMKVEIVNPPPVKEGDKKA